MSENNVQSAMFEILKAIQSDMAEVKRRLTSVETRLSSVETRLTALEERMGGLEDIARKQRRDSAGFLVMAKALTSNFTEELAIMQERVAALEARSA